MAKTELTDLDIDEITTSALLLTGTSLTAEITMPLNLESNL